MNGIHTYVELAQAAGVRRNAVGSWWRGTTPDTASIQGIAAATGYTVTELLDFLHGDGTIPRPPEPAEMAARVRAKAAERVLARQDAEASGGPPAPRKSAGYEG
jgi:transcriptional regulator with XRE-family HTH domain